jgi:hypothetical protein
MADYELRAELLRPARLICSHRWHVVLRSGVEALCGRNLDGDGTPEVRPIDEAHLVVLSCRCRTCFQLYQEQHARDQ